MLSIIFMVWIDCEIQRWSPLNQQSSILQEWHTTNVMSFVVLMSKAFQLSGFSFLIKLKAQCAWDLVLRTTKYMALETCSVLIILALYYLQNCIVSGFCHWLKMMNRSRIKPQTIPMFFLWSLFESFRKAQCAWLLGLRVTRNATFIICYCHNSLA